MKRGTLLTILCAGLITTAMPAFAGTVDFAPASTTVAAGTPIDVTLSITLGGIFSFDEAHVLIGSDDATDLFPFAVDPGWSSTFTVVGPNYDTQPGLYGNDVQISSTGGFPPAPSGTTFGTLTIDTTGMPVGGPYFVVIDPNNSDVYLNGEVVQHEDLTGSFQFNITPEPATLALFAMGGIAWPRRRR